MIVILEGPDGSGKTTLANYLVAHLSLRYHHEGVPPANASPLVYYGDTLEGWRRSGARVVADRFALGERVYGPLLRGVDQFGDEGWGVFNRLMRACGVVRVLCLPPFERCRAAWASGRPELIRDEELFSKTYWAWARLRDDRSLGDLLYDWTLISLEKITELIIQVSREKRRIPSPAVGNPDAPYLLVGDVGNGKQPGPSGELAFFGTDESSGYLTRVLRVAEVPEQDVILMNSAYRNGATWNLRQGWILQKKVVALGQRADERLTLDNVPHETIPHPQYWRRFRHHDVVSYAQRLRRACGLMADELPGMYRRS
jgi:energy-coupling factor transporter ATP-binding protein EcfA2